MVLILTEDFDDSTCEVIEWLNYFGKSIIRINQSDEISIQKIYISNEIITIVINNESIRIDLNDVTSFWYRKGGFLKDLRETVNQFPKEIRFNIASSLNEEWEALSNYLLFKLENKKIVISDSNYILPNKLIILEKAIECGLKVPITLITSFNEELQLFNNECYENIVSKSIQDIMTYIYEDKLYCTYTAKIDLQKNDQQESFFPSLFQENISKKFELRIFFIKNTFYAMAIFSASDNQTKIDFRNYNYDNPNRNVPFKLPSKLLYKIKKLIKILKLTSGSIDMICNTDNEFYFLEVNPVGQFGMISKPCNYYIERKIAEILSQ